MERGSTSSLSLPKKIKKCLGPPTLSPSPPKMVRSRRKGTEKIDDPRKCGATYLKRSCGIIKKVSALNSLTGARVAVITFSHEGKLFSFGRPSVEEVFLEYLCCKGDVKLPMSPEESLDWAVKEGDSCTTKEDCAYLIRKHLAVFNYLCRKLTDWDNNSAVKDGNGDDSGGLEDEEIEAILLAFLEKDSNPVDSAAGCDSMEVDSNCKCYDCEGWGSDPADILNLSEDRRGISALRS